MSKETNYPRVNFQDWECEVTVESYHDGSPAIRLTEVGTNAPIAVASIYVRGVELRAGEVVIKNYSENAGIPEALIEAGICEYTGRTCSSGYLEFIPIMRILIEY